MVGMTIGILAAGRPPSALSGRFGDYPEMFQALLAGRGYDWRVYDVPAGELPDEAQACAGYIVTGAAAGVYDPDPWIARLLAFLREAKGRAKLVGICFGHQAMAEAFGGKVVKSPKGWGLGLQTYAVDQPRPWMDDAAAFALAASHQDQVVAPPPGAEVTAGNDFCPNGMLVYDDGTSISCQLHPEFPPDYSIALIEGRRGSRFPEAQADAAIASLQRPDDHVRVAGWIARFLAG